MNYNSRPIIIAFWRGPLVSNAPRRNAIWSWLFSLSRDRILAVYVSDNSGEVFFGRLCFVCNFVTMLVTILRQNGYWSCHFETFHIYGGGSEIMSRLQTGLVGFSWPHKHENSTSIPTFLGTTIEIRPKLRPRPADVDRHRKCKAAACKPEIVISQAVGHPHTDLRFHPRECHDQNLSWRRYRRMSTDSFECTNGVHP